ncbi:MAG: non-heme chloroperoxidase, partial [Pseudonocardiales bacterium]|nr:non-heme chloroperoxidase [Pseudonocardiales bacterium]
MPAQVKGVLRLPPAQLRTIFPALRNPANRNKSVELTPKQFRWAFTNTMSGELGFDERLRGSGRCCCCRRRRQVSQAQDSVTAALDQQVIAQTSLVQAQQSAVTAQRALTSARVDAKRA